MSDDQKLPKNCHCGNRVAVRWSAPINSNSRPVLLVCRKGVCDLNVPIPASKVTRI